MESESSIQNCVSTAENPASESPVQNYVTATAITESEYSDKKCLTTAVNPKSPSPGQNCFLEGTNIDSEISGQTCVSTAENQESEPSDQICVSTGANSEVQKCSTATGNAAVLATPHVNAVISPDINNDPSIPTLIVKKDSDYDFSSDGTEKMLDICKSIFPNMEDIESANECDISLQNVCSLTDSHPCSSFEGMTEHNTTVPDLEPVSGKKSSAVKRRRKMRTHIRVVPKRWKKKNVAVEVAEKTDQFHDFVTPFEIDGVKLKKYPVVKIVDIVKERNLLPYSVPPFEIGGVKKVCSTDINRGNLETSVGKIEPDFDVGFSIFPKKKRGRPRKIKSAAATLSTAPSSGPEKVNGKSGNTKECRSFEIAGRTGECAQSSSKNDCTDSSVEADVSSQVLGFMISSKNVTGCHTVPFKKRKHIAQFSTQTTPGGGHGIKGVNVPGQLDSIEETIPVTTDADIKGKKNKKGSISSLLKNCDATKDTLTDQMSSATKSELPKTPKRKPGRPPKHVQSPQAILNGTNALVSQKHKVKAPSHRVGRPPVIGHFPCDRCTLTFKERPKFIKHRQTHVKAYIYCDFCDFRSRSRDIFLEHESKHTKEKHFKCKLCPYACRYRIDQQRHQAKHSKVKNYKCPYCDFTTKWKRNVSSHLLSHVEDRPFTCDICNQSFKRSCDLRYHLFRHTQLKPLNCDQCDFQCKTNFELKHHKFKHSDVRPFPCTHPGCQQACKTKSDLVKHMFVHSIDRNFPCPICGKRFKCAAARNKHILRHTDERPYICNICNKGFKVKPSLRNHMRLHNGVKPYECDVCERKFANKSNKQAHMQTHETADRPYRCPLCPYGGKSQQNLLAHVGTMHGNSYAFFCELCKKPFKRYSQLQLHYTRMHTDTELEQVRNSEGLKITIFKQVETPQTENPEEEGEIDASYIPTTRVKVERNEDDSGDVCEDFSDNVFAKPKESFSCIPKRGRPRKYPQANERSKSAKKTQTKSSIEAKTGQGRKTIQSGDQEDCQNDGEGDTGMQTESDFGDFKIFTCDGGELICQAKADDSTLTPSTIDGNTVVTSQSSELIGDATDANDKFEVKNDDQSDRENGYSKSSNADGNSKNLAIISLNNGKSDTHRSDEGNCSTTDSVAPANNLQVEGNKDNGEASMPSVAIKDKSKTDRDKRKRPSKDDQPHSSLTTFEDNFRLPLATKGFHFNFKKTGKKPRCWFMNLDAMDDESRDRQLRYLARTNQLKSKALARQLLSRKRKGTLSKYKKRFVKRAVKSERFAAGSNGSVQTNGSIQARGQYTSRLDTGPKASQVNILELNKKEGIILKPKLSKISTEMSKSFIKKVKSIPMLSRNLPLERTYIKLEPDSAPSSLPIDDGMANNAEIGNTTGGTTRNAVSGENVEKEEGNKAVSQEGVRGNTESTIPTVKRKRGRPRLLKNTAVSDGHAQISTEEQAKQPALRQQSWEQMVARKLKEKFKHDKDGIGKHAQDTGEDSRTTKRWKVRLNSPPKPVQPPTISLESPRPEKQQLKRGRPRKSPEITDVGQQPSKRGTPKKSSESDIVVGQPAKRGRPRKCPDSPKYARKQKKRFVQCSDCMRNILFGREYSEEIPENMTCPACEQLKVINAISRSKTGALNSYEKVDHRDQNDNRNKSGPGMVKNIYMVKPPPSKLIVKKVINYARKGIVYDKILSQKKKSASYSVSQKTTTDDIIEIQDLDASTSSTESQYMTFENENSCSDGSIDTSGNSTRQYVKKCASEETLAMLRNRLQKSRDEENLSKTFEIEYPQVEDELDMQCYADSRVSYNQYPLEECSTSSQVEVVSPSCEEVHYPVVRIKLEVDEDIRCMRTNYPIDDGNNNTNNSNSVRQIMEGVYPDNIHVGQDSSQLDEDIRCMRTGYPIDDGNNNTDNSHSVSQVMEGVYPDDFNVGQDSTQLENTKILVYCDDVVVTRQVHECSMEGGDNQGPALWNDPCVKTVMDDLKGEARLVDSQAGLTATADYLGCDIKQEQDGVVSTGLGSDNSNVNSEQGMLSSDQCISSEKECETPDVTTSYCEDVSFQANEGMPVILDVRSIKTEDE